MDIYSAETQVKRLLKFVEDIKTAKPRMFDKSKNRLRDLAATCADVVHTISIILQEESINADCPEFGQNNITIADSIANMQSDVNKLAAMAGTSTSMVSGLEMVAIQNSLLGTTTRKNVMAQYAVVLKTLAKTNIAYPIISDCAKLLWRWFDARFLTMNTPDFHYNIRRVGTWIADIVILFGYAEATNSANAFIEMFNKWCDDLATSDTQYAIPYEIYQFNRECDGKKLTLMSVVMWDVLLDCGLSTICASNSDVYLNEDYIYKLCDKYNPDVLDYYVNYKDDPKILSRCGLVK